MGNSRGQCCDNCVTTRSYSINGKQRWERNFGTDTFDIFVDSGNSHVIGADELTFSFVRNTEIKDSGNSIKRYNLPYTAFVFNPYNYKTLNNIGQEKVVDSFEEMDTNVVYEYDNSYDMIETSGGVLTTNALLTSKKHSYLKEVSHSPFPSNRVFYYDSGLYVTSNTKMFKYIASGKDYSLNEIIFQGDAYKTATLDSGNLFLGSQRFVYGVITTETKMDEYNKIYDNVNIIYNYPKFFNNSNNNLYESGLFITSTTGDFTLINNAKLPLGKCNFVYDNEHEKFLEFSFFKDRVELLWNDNSLCTSMSSVIYGGETVYTAKVSNNNEDRFFNQYNGNSSCEDTLLSWDILDVVQDVVECQFIIKMKKSGEYLHYSDNKYKESSFTGPGIDYYHSNKSGLLAESHGNNSTYISDTWINWYNLTKRTNDVSGCFIEFSNKNHMNPIIENIENRESGYSFSFSSNVNGNIYVTGLPVGYWKMIDSQVSVNDYSNGKYLTSIQPKIKIEDYSSDYYLTGINGGCAREIISSQSKEYREINTPKRIILEYGYVDYCQPEYSGNWLERRYHGGIYAKELSFTGAIVAGDYERDYINFLGNRPCTKVDYRDKSAFVFHNRDAVKEQTVLSRTETSSGVFAEVQFSSSKIYSDLFIPANYLGVVDLIPNGFLSSGVDFSYYNINYYIGYNQTSDFNLGAAYFPSPYPPWAMGAPVLYINKAHGSTTITGMLSFGSSGVVEPSVSTESTLTFAQQQAALIANQGNYLLTRIPIPNVSAEPFGSYDSPVISGFVSCIAGGEYQEKQSRLTASPGSVVFNSLKTIYTYTPSSVILTRGTGSFGTVYGNIRNYVSGVLVSIEQTIPGVMINGCQDIAPLGTLFITHGQNPYSINDINYPGTEHAFWSEDIPISPITPINYTITRTETVQSETWNADVYVARYSNNIYSNLSLTQNQIYPHSFHPTHYFSDPDFIHHVPFPRFAGFAYNRVDYSGINVAASCALQSEETTGYVNYFTYNNIRFIDTTTDRFGFYIIGPYTPGTYHPLTNISGTLMRSYGPHQFASCIHDGYGSGIFYNSGYHFFQGYQRTYDSTPWKFGSTGCVYVTETGLLNNKQNYNFAVNEYLPGIQYNNFGVYSSSNVILDFNKNSRIA